MADNDTVFMVFIAAVFVLVMIGAMWIDLTGALGKILEELRRRK